MSRPLIVNEAAAGDLRGKGKMRTVAFAHSPQCDNVKEWLDPSITFSPSQQDPEADHRTSSRTTHNPLPHCCHPAGMEVVWTNHPDALGTSVGLQRPQCWVLNTRLMFQTVRQDHAMPVCRCVRAHHSHTYEKTPIKRVRPFKGPNCCSKLHFEGQIHNTTGQPTSKNTFCDFRLRCSEEIWWKGIFAVHTVSYIWTDIPWLYVCSHLLATPLARSFTKERHHWPCCWMQLQPLKRQNKRARQEELGKSLDTAKPNFLCFIPVSITDFKRICEVCFCLPPHSCVCGSINPSTVISY